MANFLSISACWRFFAWLTKFGEIDPSGQFHQQKFAWLFRANVKKAAGFQKAISSFFVRNSFAQVAIFRVQIAKCCAPKKSFEFFFAKKS